MPPVLVMLLSTAYSRFMSVRSPRRRRLAKSRAYLVEPGPASKKVGIERDHHVRFFEPVISVDRTAEGKLRAGARGMRPGRLELVPFRGQAGLQHCLNLRAETSVK